MNNLEENNVYDLIKVINDNGQQVLFIDGEYFIPSAFIPADRNVSYSSLQGKHITKILSDHINIGVQDMTPVMQRIEALPERDLQFSSHYKWRWAIK